MLLKKNEVNLSGGLTANQNKRSSSFVCEASYSSTISTIRTGQSQNLAVVGSNAVFKRIFDILFSLTAIFILSPVLVIISLLVKTSSPGPIIFKQNRHGLNNEEISVWKFRTMSVMEDGEDVKQAKKNDVRITQVGKYLRMTSLDELPQFFNVLFGSMSVVGPRPHAVAHNQYYRTRIDSYVTRHIVKPGITGLAQVKGARGETETIDKMVLRLNYDLEYIEKWNLWLDIQIVCATIFKGFYNNNAY